MPQKTGLETVPEHRIWVFPFLTLDVVRAFYDLMGLRPGDPGAFQEALREATIAWRKRMERAALAGGTPPPLADFCRQVEGAIGRSATEHLLWWLQNVFSGSTRDNLGLNRWDRVLSRCRHESELWQRLGFPEELSEEALDRFRAARNVAEFYRREEEVKARPLSDWDLHMYASQLYVFEEDDIEGGGGDPFTHIKSTIRDYHGYGFWAWVLRALSPDQLDRLREGALRIVREEELTSVKELVHPTLLGIGL
jgi:hypothetical protein